MAGKYYYNGYGVAPDQSLAAAHYLAAAQLGDVDSQYFLGMMYYYGIHLDQDTREAVKWLEAAARLDHPRALMMLSYLDDAGKYHSPLARSGPRPELRGDPFLTYGLNLVEQWDNEEDSGWGIRYSCNPGSRRESFTIGVRMETNDDPKDLIAAAKSFREAADQGLPEAQHNLGVKYYLGSGVRQDFTEAVKWWRKASISGYRTPVTTWPAWSPRVEARHPIPGWQPLFLRAWPV
jgi:TPR repeat protein